MNIILTNSARMPFHTDMKLVFQALDGYPNKYDWLITEIECNYCLDDRLRNDTVFLTGDELGEILDSNDIQFIWGIFSAFSKGASLNFDTSAIPVIDGKRISSQSNPPEIQCPGSILEIICFDSSFTLIVGADEVIQRQFMAFFPEAEDLREFNMKERNR